uniref:Glycosyltransferase family 2 protein n=1 Tax=Pseudomonas graminis TaxID=158627 RepID=A0A7C1X7X1_9PSED
MCTYNGAAYLREQLESFSNQSLKNWTLYVSDDASTDPTRSILAEYQRRWGEQKLVIFDGPCQGFGKNFISLLKRPQVQARYYAFSDQDDVWFSDKLERSVKRLDAITAQPPALYCSRTRLIDATGRVIGFSPLFSRPPSFRNALVQSLAGANTMVINSTAREALLQLPAEARVIAHDWLAYLVVTACGGTAIYDADPTLDYRQHDANLIGANATLQDRAVRLRKMLSGRFAQWNDANLETLEAIAPLITVPNMLTLDHFAKGRSLRFLARIMEFIHSGVYRQTVPGNITLWLAVCLGKI